MRYIIYVLCSTLFWALNFHLAVFMVRSTTAVESAFWRYFVGVLVLAIFLIFNPPKRSKLTANLKGILSSGLIGLFGFNLFFFIGMQYTSALNAALIGATNPAVTSILGYLMYKEKINRVQFLSIITSFLGVLILITQGRPFAILDLQFNIGDLYIMGSNICFALYHIFAARYGKGMDNINFTFFTNLACLLPFCILLVTFVPVGEVSTYPNLFWISALGMGVLGTAAAYYLWNIGLQHMGAANASLYSNMIPVFTALLSWIFGDPLYFYHFWSAIFIIIGLVMVQMSRRKIITSSAK